MNLFKSFYTSVFYSDEEFLNAIMDMYSIEQFDLDPTYSKGVFYKNIKRPKKCYDKNPQYDFVKQVDLNDGLPDDNNSINSIVFDPPFMFGKHGKTDEYVMTKRFTMFDNFEELKKMYKNSLKEFYRVLKNNGYVFFKIQDYTDSLTTLTHCYVWLWSKEIGFYVKDIAIVIPKKNPIYNTKLKQRHFKKIHNYWLILQKKGV